METKDEIDPDLTLKGLRHTVATILNEMGCNDHTFADSLAHKTSVMVGRYTSRANTGSKLAKVAAEFKAELNARRTQTIKLTG